jgi:hypothetical protein
MKDTRETMTGDEFVTSVLELNEIIADRVARIEAFTGRAHTELRGHARAALITHLQHIRERGDKCEKSARLLCEMLWGSDSPIPDSFWATAFGSDVAWAIGYPRDAVDLKIATAVLRMGRQAVWKHTSAGTLTLTPEGLRDYVRNSESWARLVSTGRR